MTAKPWGTCTPDCISSASLPIFEPPAAIARCGSTSSIQTTASQLWVVTSLVPSGSLTSAAVMGTSGAAVTRRLPRGRRRWVPEWWWLRMWWWLPCSGW